LGKKADLFAPAPAGIHPEWYFLWMFQALKYAPATIAGASGELLVLVPVTLGSIVLVFLPFLDVSTTRSRWIIKALTAVTVVIIAALTVLALTAKVQ
jgi:quinol-cytochrome oxidoreductase complex cytochrome b subunit